MAEGEALSPTRRSWRSAVAIAPVAVGLLLLAGTFWSRTPRQATPGDLPPVAPPVAQPRQVAPNVWVVPRAARDDYFQERDRAGREVVLSPVSGAEKGSVERLTIARVLPGCPLLAAGFRENDRILMVNETPVATLSQAMILRSEIKSASSLTVRIEREGRIINYRFDFE